MFSGVTLVGLLLAAVGQALAVAVILRRYRLPRQVLPRLVWRLLAADALVVAAMLLLALLSREANQGDRTWRMVVIATHLGLAIAVPSAI